MNALSDNNLQHAFDVLDIIGKKDKELHQKLTQEMEQFKLYNEKLV